MIERPIPTEARTIGRNRAANCQLRTVSPSGTRTPLLNAATPNAAVCVVDCENQDDLDFDKLVEYRTAFRLREIQRHASFVAVERVEEVTFARSLKKMWADATRHVAAVVRVFDLDDLCALVGEEHGPKRSGSILFNGDDTHARQW